MPFIRFFNQAFVNVKECKSVNVKVKVVKVKVVRPYPLIRGHSILLKVGASISFRHID
jgi:hypothetical protein